MKNLIIILFISTLASCAQYKPIIPKDYTGELASIGDTYHRKSRGSADYYYVESINGKKLNNAVNQSLAASYGQGPNLTTIGVSREVPVQPLKVFIVAKVIHSMPIANLIDSNSKNHAKGMVEFTPNANTNYLVKGHLSKKYSAVWLEDSNGNVVAKYMGNVDPALKGASEERSIYESIGSESMQLTKSEIFLKISSGETVKSVTDKLGQPDNIIKIKDRLNIVKSTPTIYEYKGLGKIQFFSIQPENLTVEKIMRNAQLVGEDANAVKKRIDAEDAATLRLSARQYYETEMPETAVLDVFAMKIWSERKTTDKNMEDAMAWFCNILAKSKNSRYRNFLASLAKESKSKKLQRYAMSNAKKLPDKDIEQFIPNN